MAPPVSALSLLVFTCHALALSNARLCGLDTTVLWTVGDHLEQPDRRTKPKAPLSYEIVGGCEIPSVDELVELLANRHVHLSGDSTLRMPLQHFECDWGRCERAKHGLRSTRDDATSVDHKMCIMAQDGNNQLEWRERPMDLFALSFERATHIRLQFSTTWWHDWVNGFDQVPADELEPLVCGASRADVRKPRKLGVSSPPLPVPLGLFEPPPSPSPASTVNPSPTTEARAGPYQRPSPLPPRCRAPQADVTLSDKERMRRLPDALVIGNWAWHARSWERSTDLDVFVAAYEAELRTLLRAIVMTPSYERWWARSRLYWRFALPSEVYPGNPKSPKPHFDRQDSVDACNAVAARLLNEIAPGIIHLNQSGLLQLADPSAAAAAVEEKKLMLTNDGLHFRHDVQTLLMRHTLTVILQNFAEVESETASRTSSVSFTSSASASPSPSASYSSTPTSSVSESSSRQNKKSSKTQRDAPASSSARKAKPGPRRKP